MSTCPFHQNKLRADLPPLTHRLAQLPIDARGYPVPFFVAWIHGQPEFRIADPIKLVQCLTQKLCWVCGQKLRGEKTFPSAPCAR